ncbi:DNA cytosine methyltransferase [Escherichia coli]
MGGIRRGFESIGGQCVFTSESNKHAVRTYKPIIIATGDASF